jgi:hypothetical protein
VCLLLGPPIRRSVPVGVCLQCESMIFHLPCLHCRSERGNPDDDLHHGTAIPCMYASRSLAGDNVFHVNKQLKVKSYTSLRHSSRGDFKRQKACDIEKDATTETATAPGPEDDKHPTTLMTQAFHGIPVGQTRHRSSYTGGTLMTSDLGRRPLSCMRLGALRVVTFP